MKKLLISQEATICFDAIDFNKVGFDVEFNLVSEDGSYIKDDSDPAKDIKGIDAVFNQTTNKYEVKITINGVTVNQYARIFWRAGKDGVPVEIPEEYDPEEVQLINHSVIAEQEVVPIQYFIDYVLAPDTKLDEFYKKAIELYPRDGLRRMLLASQGNLEFRTKLGFFKTELIEKRDYYFDEMFGDTFWLFQTYRRPIVSVSELSLWHGNVKIITIPGEYMVIEPTMGTVEFVPNAFAGGILYQQLIASGDAVALAVIGRGRAIRIPLGFQLTYISGLDFSQLSAPKKESFRYAVARNCLIQLLPSIDPAMRMPSESESVDGVSMSSTKQVQGVIKQLIDNEKDWVIDIQKEYGTAFDMVLV